MSEEKIEFEKAVLNVHKNLLPHSIELSKTTRGYTWGIKVYFSDPEEALKQIEELDKKLKEMFGGE